MSLFAVITSFKNFFSSLVWMYRQDSQHQCGGCDGPCSSGEQSIENNPHNLPSAPARPHRIPATLLQARLRAPGMGQATRPPRHLWGDHLCLLHLCGRAMAWGGQGQSYGWPARLPVLPDRFGSRAELRRLCQGEKWHGGMSLSFIDRPLHVLLLHHFDHCCTESPVCPRDVAVFSSSSMLPQNFV